MESNEHSELLNLRDSLFNTRHTVVDPRHTGFRKIVIPLLISGTLFVALGGICIRNGITIPAYLLFIFQFTGVVIGMRRAYSIGKTNPVFRLIRWKSGEFLALKLAVLSAIALALGSSVLILLLGLEGAYFWLLAGGIMRIIALSAIFLLLDRMIGNKAAAIESGTGLPIEASILLYDQVSHPNRRMDKPEGHD